jgi:hypothetical protein
MASHHPGGRGLAPQPEGSRSLFSEDGTDLTLIRWMRSLTPEQRLRVLQNHVRAIERLRNARRKP